MHPMINVAIKAARSAGNIINRASLNLERLQVARKQRMRLLKFYVRRILRTTF